MEPDTDRSLLAREAPKPSWVKRVLCCYKPSDDSFVSISQIGDLPSPSQATEERRPQVRYPVLDYAAERVYLLGRGPNKVFALLHHINLAEDPGHLTDARPINTDSLPRSLWKRRLDLFSKFDEGIRVDVSTWKDCIHERIAKVIAKRCKNEKVFDAFCGCGINAIQFARHCQVVALDLDPVKIEYAKHNASIYDVSEKVSFFQGDFTILADQIRADVVFLDPPRTGVPSAEDCNLEDLYSSPPLTDILRKAQKHAKSILLYLPKEANLDEVAYIVKEYTHFDCAIEFDVFYQRGEVLGICLVMGAAVTLPHRDVLRLTASRLGLKDAEELKVLEGIMAIAGLRKVVDLLVSVDALSSLSASRVSEDRSTSSKSSAFFALAREDPEVAWDSVLRKSSDEEVSEEPPSQALFISGIIRLHRVDGGDESAEVIRMILLHKNLKFVDHHISLAKYDSSRLSELSEFGVFPVCEFAEKKLIQTKPATRFLAHVLGLYPEDRVQVYQVESLCDYVLDAHNSTAEAQDTREAVATAVQLIAKRLASMTAVKMSLHDFYILWFLHRWKAELPSELPPALARLWERIASGSLSEYAK